MNHEVLGAFLLKEDKEINDVLARHGKTALEIEKIFEKSDPENTLIEIISSDLDCDRLDYLKRTALHTGLPYGSVDTEYLTSQATLDSNGAFAYTAKAARAADHLLVSRYYDYLQVPFNKTVAALEWSLTTVIDKLLSEGLLDCSPQHIRTWLQEQKWSDFDDNYFIARFRELYRRDSVDELTRSHLCAVLERRPAKTAFQYQSLIARDQVASVNQAATAAGEILKSIGSKLGIQQERLVVWGLQVDFAKYQPAVDDDQAGAVRVICGDGLTSAPLCMRPGMLFGSLLNYSHRGFRVFYLPAASENERNTETVLNELRTALAAQFPEM